MPLHRYASRNAADAPGEKGLMCERRRGKGRSRNEGRIKSLFMEEFRRYSYNREDS
jgi:hypothetical protein